MKSRPQSSKTAQQFNRELLASCADLAWWFGWGMSEIYAMPIDEFTDWLNEANRQIKAKYQKAK